MRHLKRVKKLNLPVGHRQSLLKNLARSVFTHYGIVTTVSKAKESSKFISHLITFAKSNSISARRQVFASLQDEGLVKKLFDDIAPRFADRKGGYTRIIHLGPRKGDGAEQALLELVGFEEELRKRQDELATRRKEKEESRLKGST
ncbi:MAG: 50S ribosomal protein L17 [Candidatus Stahlbacteria bacterium]|nr:50S ribosomal protein L17 [Candidatus Stahlbacteria bacterium]